MTRSSIIFGLLLLVGAASSTAADDKQQDSPKERSQRLQSYLDDEEYRFRPMLASVDWSFGQYTGVPRLQMIYDSKRYGVTFRFGKDGDLLELHGHDGTQGLRINSSVTYLSVWVTAQFKKLNAFTNGRGAAREICIPLVSVEGHDWRVYIAYQTADGEG